MLNDFKAFIARGNVLDLAIGVIIGAAFGKVVTTFTEGIIMPIVGLLTGGTDFKSKFYDLSGKLGLVQFFSLNRALGHHAWARLDAGEVLRAYAWVGHVAWNQGPPSPAELGLGLKCYEYFESVEKSWDEPNDPILQNLERLPMLAARWSVDPAALDERHFATGRGIVGEMT